MKSHMVYRLVGFSRARIKGVDRRWFSFVSTASTYVLILAYPIVKLEQKTDEQKRPSSQTVMDGEVISWITKFEEGQEKEFGRPMGPT